MQDCETLNKMWVAPGLWGVRPAEMFTTYSLSNILPPITSPQLVDLATIRSVTSCYMGGGDEITQDGKTFTPFYHDQQDCVIWYQGSDKKIYFPSWSDEKMTLCADSMEEFTSRIAIETSLWFKLKDVRETEKGDYFAMTFQKDPILKNWAKFTPQEQAYITYFFEQAQK